jgi:hypothetical protein
LEGFELTVGMLKKKMQKMIQARFPDFGQLNGHFSGRLRPDLFPFGNKI